jgi:hypothetical protein
MLPIQLEHKFPLSITKFLYNILELDVQNSFPGFFFNLILLLILNYVNFIIGSLFSHFKMLLLH